MLGAVFQVVFFSFLVRWLGEIRLMRYCLIFSAVPVFCMTLVHAYFMIPLVTIPIFVSFDLMRPAVTNYLSRIAGDEQGFAAGMNSMFTSIGNVLGPVVGGLLFDVNLDYPFYFATILLIIGIGVTFAWKEA